MKRVSTSFLSFPFIVMAFSVFLTSTVTAQETEHTLQKKMGTESPKASLDKIAWIQGHWRGEAFGGIVEEIWSPPLGNSMMCVFKLVVDGKTKFYEIVTIAEESETLIMRLKHFHEDLVGWEQKEETVDFELVKVEKNRVYFDGFTFEKAGPDEINIYVVVSDEPGNRNEVMFNYKRTSNSPKETGIALEGFTLATRKMDTLKDFYAEVFGVAFTPVNMFDTILYSGNLAGLKLLLCPAEVAKNTAQQNRHQFDIVVSDIYETVTLVQEKGGVISGEVTEDENYLSVGIKDPDNNSIVLKQQKN